MYSLNLLGDIVSPFFLLYSLCLFLCQHIMMHFKSSEFNDQIKILRFTLIALVLSIIWLVFNPIWFPQAKLKYDLGRIFLLFVAILAATIAYITYKRKLINR